MTLRLVPFPGSGWPRRRDRTLNGWYAAGNRARVSCVVSGPAAHFPPLTPKGPPIYSRPNRGGPLVGLVRLGKQRQQILELPVLMRSPRHALAIALLMVSTLAGVPRAHAQSWLADRDRAEGPGFRVGDLELHPGLGAEIGWDSNLYYTQDAADPRTPRVDTAILRITPHLLVSTIGAERRREGEATGGDPPTVTFRGGISAAYYEFFAAPERRNLSLDIGLRLNVLPERPFSFTVFNNFTRAIRPFTENIGARAAGAARIGNQAGLELLFQTTGGIFQVRTGYTFGLDFFEDGAFQYGNSFTHAIALAESFRFLPQTAIVQDNTVTIGDYFSADSAIAAAPTRLSDSVRLRSRVGLNGAITNELSLSGMIGYAAGFFTSPLVAGPIAYAQEYDSVVAQVEARWQISEGLRLAIGYDRDFFAAFLGNYYSRDRGYANFQALIAGSFILGLEADVGYLDYGNPIAPDGTPIGIPGGSTDAAHREDIRVTAGLFAEYRFTDWLAINGTARYQGNFTDFRYDVDGGTAGTFLDPASYNKVELFLGVRAFY